MRLHVAIRQQPVSIFFFFLEKKNPMVRGRKSRMPLENELVWEDEDGEGGL